MKKPKASLESFGKMLRQLREERRLGLREVCRLTKYDPSNWSKIERGIIPPPDDISTLKLWAESLGLEKNSDTYNSFIDKAYIAQNIIPQALPEEKLVKLLPAFFRTIRNEKPSKEDLDRLIKLIKESSS